MDDCIARHMCLGSLRGRDSNEGQSSLDDLILRPQPKVDQRQGNELTKLSQHHRNCPENLNELCIHHPTACISFHM